MNVRKRKLPLGMMAVLLVLALTTIGVAFGLWSKVLTIDGTVNTGNVDAIWVSAVTTDPESQVPGDPTLGSKDLKDTVGNRYDKNVGWLDCTIDGGDPQILNFTIHNAYPSYYADCEVAWENVGTIPVKVVGLRAGPAAGPLVSIPFDSFADIDLDGDGKFDINFMVENGLCTQVDPGQKDAYSLWVHVKQDAPQDTPLTFKAEVQLNQWNESSPPCSP